MIAFYNVGIKNFIILTSISAAAIYTSLPLGSYPFWIAVNILFLVFIWRLRPIYFNENVLMALKIFLVWVAFGFIRGVFSAENYWEWKSLISFSLVMLSTSIAFLATSELFVIKILSFWYKYGLWLTFLFIPFLKVTTFYGTYLAPILLLLLLFPLLPLKWKILALVFSFMVFLAGFDSRSNIIRFFVAFALGAIYYIPFIKKEMLLKILHFILSTSPILLLILALSGTFNIFKMDQYISGDYSYESSHAGKSESLTADTRTGLYVENIASALKNDYVIQGRTPGKGYDSKAFGDYVAFSLDTGKKVRYASEVSMLNIFTWYGMIGVVLYSLIFIVGSYLAVYRSNNYFIKLIGTFVIFRWGYGFVEEFSRVDIQMMMLWILIGMCYSGTFRRMNNHDFKQFTRRMLPRIKI